MKTASLHFDNIARVARYTHENPDVTHTHTHTHLYIASDILLCIKHTSLSKQRPDFKIVFFSISVMAFACILHTAQNWNQTR